MILRSRREFLSTCTSCVAYGLLTQGPARAFAQEGNTQRGRIRPERARYYTNLDPETTQCLLCPNRCIRKPGTRGRCNARENRGGEYVSLVYNAPCLIQLDKIEKLPLYHFAPGESVFSIATAGCNLSCKYCQNWQFSQKPPYETENYFLTPQEVVQKAVDGGCKTIAFFYTEPVVYFEYMVDIAKAARRRGMRSVMVSAGYINDEPLREILAIIDGVTFGFKGFNDQYYTDVVGGKREHVLHTLELLEKSNVWYEMVNLIVPTLNDNPDDIRGLCGWIKSNLGADRPLHFTRFVPEFQLRNLPMTSQRTLEEARKIGFEAGLSYVYAGNMPGHEGNNTYCPHCRQVLIQRIGVKMKKNNLKRERCPSCGSSQAGRWA